MTDIHTVCMYVLTAGFETALRYNTNSISLTKDGEREGRMDGVVLVLDLILTDAYIPYPNPRILFASHERKN